MMGRPIDYDGNQPTAMITDDDDGGKKEGLAVAEGDMGEEMTADRPPKTT